MRLSEIVYLVYSICKYLPQDYSRLLLRFPVLADPSPLHKREGVLCFWRESWLIVYRRMLAALCAQHKETTRFKVSAQCSIPARYHESAQCISLSCGILTKTNNNAGQHEKRKQRSQSKLAVEQLEGKNWSWWASPSRQGHDPIK